MPLPRSVPALAVVLALGLVAALRAGSVRAFTAARHHRRRTDAAAGGGRSRRARARLQGRARRQEADPDGAADGRPAGWLRRARARRARRPIGRRRPRRRVHPAARRHGKRRRPAGRPARDRQARARGARAAAARDRAPPGVRRGPEPAPLPARRAPAVHGQGRQPPQRARAGVRRLRRRQRAPDADGGGDGAVPRQDAVRLRRHAGRQLLSRRDGQPRRSALAARLRAAVRADAHPFLPVAGQPRLGAGGQPRRRDPVFGRSRRSGRCRPTATRSSRARCSSSPIDTNLDHARPARVAGSRARPQQGALEDRLRAPPDLFVRLARRRRGSARQPAAGAARAREHLPRRPRSRSAAHRARRRRALRRRGRRRRRPRARSRRVRVRSTRPARTASPSSRRPGARSL